MSVSLSSKIKEKSVLLVDGLNLSFRWKHKKQRNFAADYLRTIDSLATSYNADKIIVCSDWGSSSYRKALYPEYKGNREELRAKQTEEEKQEFNDFFTDFQAALDLVAEIHPVVRYQGVEADDIIAVICQRIETPAWIVSSDKDLDQLVSPNTSRFSYVTRKETTWDNFRATHGCTVEEFISVKVLNGDTGDNVFGVPGIGPKRALSLVRKYGSAFDIYDSLPLEGTQKYIEAVNTSGDLIPRNYALMDLAFSAEALGENNLLNLTEVLRGENLL